MSGEHIRPQFATDLDDHICRHIRAPRRNANGLRTRRLIKAIGLHLVGSEKGEQPFDAYLIIDAVDGVQAVLGGFHAFGKISLDQISRHGVPRHFETASLALRCNRPPIPMRSAAAIAMLRNSAASTLSPFRSRANSMRAYSKRVSARRGHAFNRSFMASEALKWVSALSQS